MATYSSSQYTNAVPAFSHGLAGNLKAAYASVVCPSSPATTDTLNFFYLPATARIVAAFLQSTDMDTNGSPTIALNIGWSGTAAGIFSASTVAQAGTNSAAIAVAGFGTQPSTTARTLITGTASTNAATGAAGTVTLLVLYTVDGGAS